MPEAVIYRDDRITVTRERVEAGAVSCPVADIRSTMVTGGTGLEEKIFLGLIVVFGIGIALVGILLKDNGELALGLGLALVTALIIGQKCTLRLVTDSGKLTLLTDPSVRHIRQVRDRIEEAMGRTP